SEHTNLSSDRRSLATISCLRPDSAFEPLTACGLYVESKWVYLEQREWKRLRQVFGQGVNNGSSWGFLGNELGLARRRFGAAPTRLSSMATLCQLASVSCHISLFRYVFRLQFNRGLYVSCF
ncbi:hypothetical protein PIB30_099176, partial [Stylosanthes scabra]|nr:hypothetical protein [Stylosanthes scabra]